ncbi:MAG TPA: c-type cytochrome domain-containing protein [Candidatus Dormibacteraeota bacterium]|nr:c-type cytochrome domain-containing protein [Candidatus Dormibacteraeota bacterium]
MSLWFSLLVLSCTGRAEDKTTYQEHVFPLIEANCAKCHNEDKKKADLDLTSYQGVLRGSGSGPVVASGSPDSSKLWKALTHSEEPYMPPNRPGLAEQELAVFKKWITDGLLENSGGKPVAAAEGAIDLSLKAEAVGKPDGPPPMPGNLSKKVLLHTGRANAITGLAASPWAPLIAVAGQKEVLLFNSESQQLLGVLPFPEGQPMELKFSRNGKLLLAAGGIGAKAGRIAVWDITTGERSLTVSGEYDTVLTSDIRPDQTQIAFGGPTRLVKLYSIKAATVQQKLKKHTDWVTAVAYSPNGEMLASADRNGGICVWDPDNAQEIHTLAGHKAAVTGLAWRGDSKVLASASEDGTVKLWELKEGKQVKSWNAHPSGVLNVSFSHDGRLVTCGRDNAITLWSATGSKLKNVTPAPELPLRAVFTADQDRIVTSDFSGNVTAWDAKSGKTTGTFNANPHPEKVAAAR